MRRRVFIPLLLALAATLLGACKANDTAGSAGAALQKAADRAAGAAPASRTTQVDADGVRRVTVEELQGMLADGRAVIYDTRAKVAYDAEHIKGAASMPFDEVERRAGELPRDKTLVFYCT